MDTRGGQLVVNGLRDVGNSYADVNLSVTNELGLNGTALVGNPTNSWWGYMNLEGSQTLSGNGTVIFGNQVSQGYNALRLTAGGTTLTLKLTPCRITCSRICSLARKCMTSKD